MGEGDCGEDSPEMFPLIDPTLIADGKYLVYGGGNEQKGASLHLYDLENHCTVATISSAEVLIDSYKNVETGDIHLLCLRANNNQDEKPDEDDEAFAEWEDMQKHWTELIEIKINLIKLQQHSDKLKRLGKDSTKDIEAELIPKEVIVSTIEEEAWS